jgi:hypothetical protein
MASKPIWWKGLISFPLLICLLLETPLWPAQSNKKDNLEKTSIGFGYGTYQVSDPRYKEVYDGGEGIYTLEILQLFHAQNPHHFGLSLGYKHFSTEGKTTITQEKTKLSLVPIALGLRYLIKISSFLPWIELGTDYYHYKEGAALRSTQGSAFGYHIAGGFYLEIPRVNFVKLLIYVKHTKCIATEDEIKVNLGGLEWGVGLVFGFDLF